MVQYNVQLYKNTFVFVCLFMYMQIIVLEDTKEYISYAPKEEIKAQDRRQFELLVCHYAEKRRESIQTRIRVLFV